MGLAHLRDMRHGDQEGFAVVDAIHVVTFKVETIGIGLNVNMLIDERKNILQPWTSMRRVVGNYVDRNLVCAALINDLQDYLSRFDRDGFAGFIAEWTAAEGMMGKMVAVKTVRETVTGEVVGINAQGHLMMKMSDGELRAFSSGDTSIVKKY